VALFSSNMDTSTNETMFIKYPSGIVVGVSTSMAPPLIEPSLNVKSIVTVRCSGLLKSRTVEEALTVASFDGLV